MLVNHQHRTTVSVGPKLLVIIISYYFIQGAPALESETHAQNTPDCNPIGSGGGGMDGRWSRWRLNQDAEINVALLKPPQVPGAGDLRAATTVGSLKLRTLCDRRRREVGLLLLLVM